MTFVQARDGPSHTSLGGGVSSLGWSLTERKRVDRVEVARGRRTSPEKTPEGQCCAWMGIPSSPFTAPLSPGSQAGPLGD